jgi:hypothetical protein
MDVTSAVAGDGWARQESARVLAILSRTRAVFGGDREPQLPADFRTAPDLEGDLGRGHF